MANIKKYKTEIRRKIAAYNSTNESHKKLTRCINVRLSIKEDADVLSVFDSVSNKADYLRQLVRYDIQNNIVDKDNINNPTFTNVKKPMSE